MDKLAAGKAQSEWSEASADQGPASAAEAMASRMVGRVRWLMIISGFTTLIAIAAVVGVIGYRISRSSGTGATTTDGIVVLPKGARVIASSATDDRLVVTLDIAGATEIRTFDLKTLKEIGRIRFATEP
ncbi:MAG: hypothetical protein ACLPX7_22370 [Xanthobacteraceae bacterium]